MTTATTTSGVRQALTQIRRTWSELDYAQRRLTEIQTGLELTKRRERRQDAAAAEDLDELHALEESRRAA